MTRLLDRRPSTQVLVRVALGLVLLAGLVDTAANRDVVGQRVDGRAPLALIDLATASRDSVHRAVHEVAPGARIVLDRDTDLGLDRVRLVGLARAREVRYEPLARVAPPDVPPVRWGPLGRDSWTLQVDDGPVDTLLVVRSGRTTALIDARLVDVRGSDASTGPPADPSRTEAPTVLRGVLVDVLLLGVLLLSGGLLLPRSIRPAGVRIPLALVVGVGLQATLGLLLLPEAWTTAMAVAVAILVAAASPVGTVGWRRTDGAALLAAGAVLLAVTVAVRTSGAVFVTTDSIDYLAASRTLADGLLGAGDLTLKRGLGLQALHAPAFALGAEGLHSLGPALLAAAVVLLASLRGGDRIAGLLAVAFLVVSPQILTHAAYVNSHLLVAVLLLAAVVLLGTRDGPPAGGGTALAVLVAAVVLLRAEGTLLAGLLLLGGLRAARPVPAAAWWSLGATTLVWNALLLRGIAQGGADPPLLLVALVGLGAALLATPLVLRRTSARVRSALPVGVVAALWVATLLLTSPLVGDIRFVTAAVENVLRGAGGWGAAGPVLVVLAVLAGLSGVRPGDGPGLHGARWVILGFVPLSLIAKLGDGVERSGADTSELLSILLRGGGRIGWGDSVNRMWMHAVLLVLVLLVLRGHEAVRGQGRRAGGGGRRVSVRRTLTVLAALASLGVGLAWQPASAGGVADDGTVGERQVRAVLDVAPDLDARVLGIVELTDRVSVAQEILVPSELDPPPGAVDVRVCAAVYPVTYRRPNDGSVDVTVSTASASETTRIRVIGLADFSPVSACLDLPGPESALDGLTVRIEGRGAGPGAAAGVAAGDPSAPSELGSGASLLGPAIVVADGSSRATGVPLALKVTVEHTLLRAATAGERTVGAATLWLPRAIAAVVALALLLPVLPARPAPGVQPATDGQVMLGGRGMRSRRARGLRGPRGSG